MFTGIKVPFIGLVLGQTSLVSLSSVCGTAVWLTIETMATDKLTLIAYTRAKPRKPRKPSVWRAFMHDLVSAGNCDLTKRILLLKWVYSQQRN